MALSISFICFILVFMRARAFASAGYVFINDVLRMRACK